MNTTPNFRAAALLLASLAAAGLTSQAVATASASTHVAVLATDYGASGRVSACATHTPWTVSSNLATTCSDAVIRYYDGLFYLINRSGCDNIQVLDPASGYATIRQFSVGAGSNPQDIAFWSATKAYVSRYDSASVWVVNPQTGAHLKSISLAPLADADGLPEMDHMILLDGKLFVSVQRLDRNNFYATTGPGRIAVIDVNADTLIDVDPVTPGKQGIVLAAGDPVTALEWNLSDRRFYVGEAGDYGVLDGGIEAVDPVTYHASGLLVREDSLGGDVNVMRLSSATQGYAIVLDASYNTSLVRFDVTTHRKFATPYPATGFVLADCLLDDLGHLWLADRTPEAPGLRVFDAASGTQLTGSPLSTGLPPSSLALDAAGVTGVREGAPPAVAVRLTALGANPFHGPMRFRVTSAAPVELRVTDVRGRTVRDLPAAGAGEHDLGWDGRDSAGRQAPSGIYWIVASGEGGSRSLRLAKV